MTGDEAATSRLPQWIGGLFAVGATCFALGSMPLYFEHVDPAVTAGTFFVGSIFFTSAAFLQWRQAVAAASGRHTTDWWATVVQLAGTLFFNVSTFGATLDGLDLEQEVRLIWAPDVFGSICFLVASWLAYAAVNRGVWPRADGTVGWRVNALNMVGSIAFGIAAVAARYVSTTGEITNIRMVNLGTFVGAACFLVGAVLLPAQAREEAPA